MSPRPNLTASPPLAQPDGCPECVVNVEPPASTATLIGTLIGAVRASYVCTDCGHAWTTDWRA